MSENPYSTPVEQRLKGDRKRGVACTVMFWLSCVLGLGMLTVAVNGGYQYWVYTSRAGFNLPSHIPAASVCVAGSAIVMLFSAWQWRRRHNIVAAASFVCSVLVFLIGPAVLPHLMT